MASEYLHWLDRKVDSHGEGSVGIGNQGPLGNCRIPRLIRIIMAAIATIACDI
jgi:hypothetical protein